VTTITQNFTLYACDTMHSHSISDLIPDIPWFRWFLWFHLSHDFS